MGVRKRPSRTPVFSHCCLYSVPCLIIFARSLKSKLLEIIPFMLRNFTHKSPKTCSQDKTVIPLSETLSFAAVVVAEKHPENKQFTTPSHMNKNATNQQHGKLGSLRMQDHLRKVLDPLKTAAPFLFTFFRVFWTLRIYIYIFISNLKLCLAGKANNQQR